MAKIYPLLSQTVASLRGKDVVSLLQKYLTFDMSKLETKKAGLAYSCLLNSRGRIEGDLFIHKNGKNYFLETHSKCFERISDILNRYKMRENFKIEKLEDSKVYHIDFSDEISTEISDLGIEMDPRFNKLGFRFINLIDPYKNFPDLEVREESDYIDLRYRLGICEGNELFGGEFIPHNFNMDLLNALSFEKGCYLGQEMVTRTQFMGFVRRRVIPFEYFVKKKEIENKEEIQKEENVEEIKKKEEIKEEIPVDDKRIFTILNGDNLVESGKVICENRERGCVLFKLEYLKENKHYMGNKENKMLKRVNIYRPPFLK